MDEFLGRIDDVASSALARLAPPPKLSLSQWADEHFYLSAESAAEPGRWRTLPYQREPMDAITDPDVTQITFMKSARVGYTKMINAAIGYFMDHDPCSILAVQPTVDDAKGYSKEEIAPMLRDCPRLAQIIFEDAEENGPKDSGNTILHKRFPGGVLSMVGANSGAGFRRVSRRVVLFDEVDAYPPSAGSDGDQIRLGIKRTEYFWNRKIIAGSTPLVAGRSRIEEMFLAGDQRRYYVPCPECGHMDFLAFRETERGGHFMQWPKDRPADAHFVCSQNGCVIEHHHKREMIEKGEWRASGHFSGHASFHIWAAYSYSPNASWGQLAEEFVAANKSGPEALKTFVNTALGETWVEKGDAPEWAHLYNRRDKYEIGTVPEGVTFLTAGVDVQKDSFRYEVVGWGPDKESWSIECGALPGDTSNEDTWIQLDQLLGRSFRSANGNTYAIRMLAVDSGYNTQAVYNWARRLLGQVIAVKGRNDQHTLLTTPKPVEVTWKGKKIARGIKLWTVGVDIAKAELYGWLKLPPGEHVSTGFCHFPEYGEDYFKQLTAEQMVTVVDRKGFAKREWQVIPGRENHFLDCRVYARAAAAVLGIDRMAPKVPAAQRVKDAQAQESGEKPVIASPQPPKPKPTRKGIGNRDKGWLSRRR